MGVSYFENDEHVGGLIGTLLGLSFVTVGSIIGFLKEDGRVPIWRLFAGLILIVLGFFALITGMVFLLEAD
jgi:hypothetical protein